MKTALALFTTTALATVAISCGGDKDNEKNQQNLSDSIVLSDITVGGTAFEQAELPVNVENKLEENTYSVSLKMKITEKGKELFNPTDIPFDKQIDGESTPEALKALDEEEASTAKSEKRSPNANTSTCGIFYMEGGAYKMAPIEGGATGDDTELNLRKDCMSLVNGAAFNVKPGVKYFLVVPEKKSDPTIKSFDSLVSKKGKLARDAKAIPLPVFTQGFDKKDIVKLSKIERTAGAGAGQQNFTVTLYKKGYLTPATNACTLTVPGYTTENKFPAALEQDTTPASTTPASTTPVTDIPTTEDHVISMNVVENAENADAERTINCGEKAPVHMNGKAAIPL